MKDFVKWLGVNEKVAKVVVWLFIIMVMLIIFNTALGSIGFPNYQITYNNLKQIDGNKFVEILLKGIVSILNFYAIVLLVFRTNKIKPLFKFAVIYMILGWIVGNLFNYAIGQIFIILFILLFCYLYSGRNYKYILYAIIGFFVNTVIEGIWYIVKVRSIDYTKINYVTKSILILDYFIIMGVIILVKEIYLKKRSEKLCGVDQDAFYGSANSKTKANSQRKSQKK